MGYKTNELTLNPKLISIAKEFDESHYYEVMLCLLSLYHGMTTRHFSQEVKDFISLRGLVERNSTVLSFTIPLYVTSYVSLTSAPTSNFSDFIAKWINKFPTQKYTNLTYAVSGNSKACGQRMKIFMGTMNKNLGIKYSVPEKYELINAATDMYLNYQKNRNWAYTKKNSKFIYDSESSILEAYCRKVLDGESSVITELVGGML